MHITRSRTTLAAAMTVATVVTLSACSAGTQSGDAPVTDLAIGSVNLAAAGCPANIVIQTDWNPEAEHAHLYELLGADYTVNSDQKSVSGPLMATGEYTGVNVEVRSGGPAIGYATVTSQMYSDDDITLGYVSTDEAIQLSADFPTVGVFAPLDKTPQMLMWDPSTYPDVTDIASLGTALAGDGGVVRYFGGAAYMEYLMSDGQLDASVVDGSYDGSPANFVAAGGKDAQQGFGSAEPYVYLNDVADWSKPVAYDYISAAGWDIYSSAVSVRAADFEEMTPCLTALVPVLQQAEVDYFTDPTATNALVLDLVDQFDTGWVYSQGVADYSVTTMIDDGLVGNGPNDTLGDFDETRMSDFLELAIPVFEGIGNVPAAGLVATDIYTNEFIDPAIGL
ncbi:ABC transporter substrate-binding protein [Salinibacterium sp. G-O1]|uniref:ABC transporter substrate-binding protein n=1 Tax=Salinibacterium sp. G-O1 TaxID=3046208 RepID=UPI0024BA5645|nr:ABC transporter substrate-binding protein [Salinibacterium sp. G-O1]MDJ0335816.1 ABC transporter substrate-binding protein [Salinibacterium sp. G-O1]